MWCSVLAGFVCIAVAIVLFTPMLRLCPVYQPTAFFFLFEGLYEIINGVITQLWGYQIVMYWIQNILIILFGIWFFIAVIQYRKQQTALKIKGEVEQKPMDTTPNEQ